MVYPEEGLGFGILGTFIPSEAPNAEAANEFINYILQPEVTAKCINSVGYYNTNKAADDLVDENLVVPDDVTKGEIARKQSRNTIRSGQNSKLPAIKADRPVRGFFRWKYTKAHPLFPE